MQVLRRRRSWKAGSIVCDGLTHAAPSGAPDFVAMKRPHAALIGEIMTDKDIRQQLAEFERLFSAGYDSRGCVGLNPPYSWESCARVALDLAHAVANGDQPLSGASGSIPSEAPK